MNRLTNIMAAAIGLGLAAVLFWAIYNWTHSHVGTPK